jgi:hypothetical protein
MAKYINPYTDFGFKKLFGEEGNKDLLMDFLNQLLPAHHQIADFQKAFGTAELAGLSEEQRRIYEENLIQYWGMKSALETAIEEREVEIAKNLISLGSNNDFIVKATGLTVEQIEQLRNI